jgi:cytochrome d ubiquinol oxidase subunit II
MTEASLWQNIWFLLLASSFAVFSVLDGFDLGAGMALPFLARSQEEKRALMSALAPVWDGNEVWLIIGGGGLFAAFAPAFSGVLSGFYTAVFLVVAALIVRATSFEFWSHTTRWRKVWETLFALGSFLIPVLLMVALGNALEGIALDSMRTYHGGLVSLLRPLPIVMGIMGACVALLHGLVYLGHKTGGAFAAKARQAALRIFWVALTTILAFVVAATVKVPSPVCPGVVWAGIVLAALSMTLLFFFLRARMARTAFAASSAAIVSLWVVIAGFQYPWLARSSVAAAAGYSIIADASTEPLLRGLGTLAIAILVLVAACTVFVYRVFRGKVDGAAGY